MNALQLIGEQSIGIIPDAIGARDAILAESQRIQRVDDELDQHEASEALTALKTMIKTVEAGRKAVKERPLALTREIDALAKAFTEPVLAEIARIEAPLAAFTRRQRDAAEAAERARRAALEEEKRRAAEAEAARARAEAEAKAAEENAARAAQAAAEAEFLGVDSIAAADAAKAAQVAAEEEKRRAAEAKAAAEAAEAARLKTAVTTTAIKAPTIPGLKLRDKWDFEVLDAAELYATRPDLVDLVPKRREILSIIKDGTQLPGLRIWKTDKIG